MILHAVLRRAHSSSFLLANSTVELICVIRLHVPRLLDNFGKDLVAEKTFEVFISGFRLALLWLCADNCKARCSLNL